MNDRRRVELRQLQQLRKMTPQRTNAPYLELISPKASREKEYVPHRVQSRFKTPFRVEESSIFPLFNSSSQMDHVLKLRKLREHDLLMLDQNPLQGITTKLPRLPSEGKQVATIFYPLVVKHRSKRKEFGVGRSNLLMRNFSHHIPEVEYDSFLENQHNLELEGTHLQYHKQPQLARKKRESLITMDERKKRLAMYEQKKQRKLSTVEKKSQSPRKDKDKDKEIFEFPLYISCILSLNGIKEVRNPGKKFKFFLGEGNNSYLVKSTIRKRFWWSVCNNRREAHFVWTQLKCKDVIERMKCLNPNGQIDAQYEEPEVQYPEKQEPIEADDQIRDKGIESAELHPLIRSDDRLMFPLMRESLDPGRLVGKLARQTLPNHDNLTDAVASLKKQQHTILEINNGRIHNHLECHWHLSNKKALFANLKHYYQSTNQQPFQHIPRTYHVKTAGDQYYKEFEEYAKSNRCVWIIKPGENTNRGNGITVAQQLSEIEALVAGGCSNSQTVILQQYIMPYLYNGRKFDIRCYMLVTSLAGRIRAYWYDEGYIRTSSKEFTLNNLQNRMIHLTNDAVQKWSEDYGRYESCNKLSFREIDKYFREQSRNFQTARQEMKTLAADSLKATYRLLDPKKREFTFEVFGLDFLIDSKMKTWLIEANTNPCLELSGSLLARIIPHMLENTLRIVLDPLFTVPEASTWPASRRFEYCSRVFSGNHYELLFDEQLDS